MVIEVRQLRKHYQVHQRQPGLGAALPVTDLTVEDPPLEEVMKELFSRGRAEAAG